MALPATGSYVIRPKINTATSLFISAPTAPTIPSVDLPVTLAAPVVPLSWYVSRGTGNTMTVYFPQEDVANFKWINTGNVLYASVTNPTPATFALRSTGDGFYVIGISGQNLLLTADATTRAITFKPANNTDSQRFQFTIGTIPSLPSGGIPVDSEMEDLKAEKK